MKILQFCQKPPLPAIDGGCVASLELSRLIMSAGHDLKLVSLATEKHPWRPDDIDPEFSKKTDFEAIAIKTGIRPFDLLISFLSGKSLQRKRFYRKKVCQWIHDHFSVNNYEIVILDGLMTSYYLEEIRKVTGANIVYRSHNIESSIFFQQSQLSHRFWEKFIYQREAGFIMNLENEIWRKVKATWSISESDTNLIRKGDESIRAHWLPISMDMDRANYSPEPNSLFHLGAMDWKPNFQGVKWFLDSVWKDLSLAKPDLKLHLAGKGISMLHSELRREKVVLHDEVHEATDFYKKYDIMIVPVLSGGGVRIKLIQALAQGKPIVTTEKGAEGSGGSHGKNMLICRDSHEMRQCLLDVLEKPSLKDSISKGARELFDEYYSREKVQKMLNNLIKEIS